MPQRLTINEAAKLTGYSDSKIRRFIHAIVADPDHPDRAEIDPCHEELQRLKGEGVQHTYRVSEELLRREFGRKASEDVTDDSSDDLISILHEQLIAKDKQIEMLSERIKESNLLNMNLQNRVLLEQKPRGMLGWFRKSNAVALKERPGN